MRLISVGAVGLLLCIPVLAGSGPGSHPAAPSPAPTSCEVIDAAPFNAEAALAARNGAMWPRSAMEFVVHRLGMGDELPLRFHLAVESPDGQVAGHVKVTAWAEGLHDDSIDGEWVYLEMEKGADGVWGVTREHRAWRCARGGHVDGYDKEPCP